MNFRRDLKLPAQAYELVMSRIPRIRRWPGDLTGLVWLPYPPHWLTGWRGQHERGHVLRCELAVVPARY
jgi:hypothetical protein